MMPPSLLQKFATPAPRYTSYPTAPHFHDQVGIETYRNWLSSISPQQSLSLYAHIPFCDTMCWFCGCNTKLTRRYQPVTGYLPFIKAEAATTAGLIAKDATVKTIHWGGGSPTILTPEDILALASHFANQFNIDCNAEFSVEIDPRGLGQDRIDALAQAGVTRASIGVQDFDQKVQDAINRRQSFAETRDVMLGLRAAGITRINIDLIYGLPWQTIKGVARTIDQVVELKPSRIAVFGYAHVPWMKRHQKMIDDAALPDVTERFKQSQEMANLLCQEGYVRIGMDHFALPDDPLCVAKREGRLRRNFQGYTDDPADVLVGLGASAIGKLHTGYIQNATPTAQYTALIEKHGLAAVKGYALGEQDHLRAHVIERLICDYEFSTTDVLQKFGPDAQEIIKIAQKFAADEGRDLVKWHDETFSITPEGQPFVRNVCAQFDAFLHSGNARHSLSV